MELTARRITGLGISPSFYIFGAILLLRAVALARMADSPFLVPAQGDMLFYDEWARRILHGQTPGRMAFYGLPGYPYLLAVIYYLIGSNPFVPELLGACADAFTGVLIYKISTRLFTRTALAPARGSYIGIIGALGWAFFQPAAAYGVVLMPTALSVFVFWLVIWQIIKHDKLPKLAWFVLIGVLIGVSAMVVATILCLLPLLVAACFVKWRAATAWAQFWKARLLCILLVLLGVASGTSPCWIHNYVYARDWVVLSAHSGVNFWIGNNPAATGYPNFPPGLHAGQASMLQDSINAAERAAGRPLKRSQVSAYWSKQAHAFIDQNFIAWLRLLGTKLANFWSAFQYDDLSIITMLREEQIILPGISFGLVATLALAASVFAIANAPAAGWVAGSILLQMCAVLTVFVTERYRLAAVPGLLIFAAYGLWAFAHHCAQVRLKPLIAYTGLLTLAVMLVTRPKGDPSLWALDAYNSGIMAMDLHRYERAEKKLSLAYEYAPNNAEVNFALGNLRLAEGDIAKASAFYLTTLRLDERHAGALNNLGVLALDQGQFKIAGDWLRRALELDTHNAKTHFLLAGAYAGEGERMAARGEIEAAIALNPAQPEFRAFREKLARE